MRKRDTSQEGVRQVEQITDSKPVRAAVALYFGVYNFVRRHETLGTTPAVAAGVELKRWSLEDVFEMKDVYLRRKEEARFEAAFAAIKF